jgi:hypothetical protein
MINHGGLKRCFCVGPGGEKAVIQMPVQAIAILENLNLLGQGGTDFRMGA